MNSFAGVVNSLIDEKMMNLSTAFIGRIISFNQDEKTATVQPLTKTKAYGKSAKNQAVLTNIPVSHNAHYKLNYRYVTCGGQGCEGFSGYFAEKAFIAAGDLCVCIVADRDITEARKGKSAVPAIGHHEIQNAIVIGIL